MINSQHSIGNRWCQLLREGSIQFGGKGCPSDGKEELSIDFLFQLEAVKKLREKNLSFLEELISR